MLKSNLLIFISVAMIIEQIGLDSEFRYASRIATRAPFWDMSQEKKKRYSFRSDREWNKLMIIQ